MRQMHQFGKHWAIATVHSLVLLAIAMVLSLAGSVATCEADDQKLTSEQAEFFEAKIRPILVQHCYECHSTDAEDIEGGLVLDSRWGWETGGDSGPAIVPGDLNESFLIDAVRYEENVVSAMPPKTKLPDEQIQLLERWVQMGAPDPRAKVEKSAASSVESFSLQQRLKDHWCWRPIDDPPPPNVGDEAWPLGDIDRFILHRLASAGIVPAAAADKPIWLRRVYFDLIGLPPTIEQIDAFVADESEAAYEKVVTQLLGSPQFGEKWARHWMDLVRYAETYGHEFDYPIPHASEYRDYLIRALNADVPYNQLVIEHIAGDLLESPRMHPTERFNESVIGTGFWYLHEATHAPTDVLKNEADIIDNQLDVFGKAFLGLTVACARCHDHKFDAIATDDYYALSAFIQSSCRQLYPLDPGERINNAITRVQDLQERARDHLSKAATSSLRPSPADYFRTAALLIRKAIDDPAARDDSVEVFDDFESDYALWTVSGDAFADRPANKPAAPEKEIRGKVGSGFVSSYSGSDNKKGELVSQPFLVQRDYIHLKIGGGNQKVGVEFRVDGKVVHRAAGANREDLLDHVWDVRTYVGKQATIRIFDENESGWGHVNVDQIVFTNQGTSGNNGLPTPSPVLIAEEAERSKLNAERLTRWIRVLKNADVTAVNPTATDALAARINDPDRCQKLRDQLASERARRESYATDNELFESFGGDDLPSGWTTTGAAFQAVGTKPRMNVIKSHSLPGTVDSGYFGTKATGVLRSPTFTITTPNIHVRTRATANVTMTVIIDNYQMIAFHGLLFKGTQTKGGASDTKRKWEWKSFAGDLKKYLGHNAYLEFVDNGDAAIAIDEIWFSGGGPPPAKLDPLVEQFAAKDFSFDRAWTRAVSDARDSHQSELIEWLQKNELFSADELAPGLAAIVDEAQQVTSEIPRPRFVLAMAEGTRENAAVYIRGSHTNLGKKVPPRNLKALGGDEGTRLELARQIASADNPLVARVIVNRIWHHLFGRGIVPSVDDFGPQGQPASHPQLLDHLASDFIVNGWSIKTAIEKMVLSQTYRQSSVAHPTNDPNMIATADPTNSLLHRMRVRRLPAESIRDSILAVSGRLDKQPFGPSVATHRTPFMTGRGARGSGPLDGDGRRTIYLSVYRNFMNPFLTTFDMPNPFGPKGRRSNSNVPAQALTLMNDPFVVQQSKLWADKLTSSSDDPQSRIRLAVKHAQGVDATDSQVERLQRFLDKQIAQGASESQAWSDLAHSLLNMKAFYYLK